MLAGRLHELPSKVVTFPNRSSTAAQNDPDGHDTADAINAGSTSAGADHPAVDADVADGPPSSSRPTTATRRTRACARRSLARERLMLEILWWSAMTPPMPCVRGVSAHRDGPRCGGASLLRSHHPFAAAGAARIHHRTRETGTSGEHDTSCAFLSRIPAFCSGYRGMRGFPYVDSRKVVPLDAEVGACRREERRLLGACRRRSMRSPTVQRVASSCGPRPWRTTQRGRQPSRCHACTAADRHCHR